VSRASASSERAAHADELAAGGEFALRTAAATHPGLVRRRNEDRFHADAARGVFLVVDGMGGEAAGDRAAEIAVTMIRQRLERPAGTPEERIREAIAVANDEILAKARQNPAWSGMGCVLTVALVEEGRVTVGQVGDSRLYLLRERRIEKMTRDHSPVGDREDRGELDERAAMEHPRRHEVYRSVGERPHGPFDRDFVDIESFRLRPDDALLLCTDGLTDRVASAEILELAARYAANPENVVQRLIGAALAHGGKDNVSVVFAAGPRFASAWSGDAAASGVIAAPASARERGSRLLRRRWVHFALGAACGAAITLAVWVLGAGRTLPAPAGMSGAAAGPTVLSVGPGQRFASIGDALGAAGPGDTVLVRPGTYREQIRLEDGVTLISATPRAATLVPTAGGTAVVAMVAEGIGSGRISGFTIRAGAAPLDVGIRLRDAAVAIEDVEITDARLAGVLIEGGRPAAVKASWIHDNPGAGILVRARGAARLAHNRVEDNGRSARAAAPGIELEPGARAELVDNVIAGNAGAGVRGLPRRQQGVVLARNLFEAGGKVSRPPLAPARPGSTR
jgi:PPM family protein phosphatase